MTKTELEKKPLSDLHALAADAGVERFRMLSKAELVDRLAEGDGDSGGGGGRDSGGGRAPRSGRSRSASGSGSGRTGTDGRSGGSGGGRSGRSGEGEGSGGSDSGRSRGGRSDRSGEGRSGGSGEGGERSRRRRRRSGSGSDSGSGSGSSGSSGREREAPHSETEEEGAERLPEPTPPERAPAPTPVDRSADEASARPKRRRRRRRFGRRKDGVSLQDLLLPPEAGRQAVLVGETRAACTALLRGVAAELAGDSKGPDPVALLIDPTPEELADWKREAPQAEIVAAGQARHATDALALAKTRAAEEDVILLVDSLTRLAEDFGDVDTAKDFFDAGQAVAGTGSLTIVVALEHSAD